MADTWKLYPNNTRTYEVRLMAPAPGRPGRKKPVTSGVVTGFIATSDTPDALPADPTLVVSGVHISKGWWRVTFPEGVLPYSLLDPLFQTGTPKPVLIVQGGGARVTKILTYDRSREA